MKTADSMRICVCFIYYKPVMPNYYILDLEQEDWMHFRRARTKETRAHLICSLLGRESLEQYIRELAWIPLYGSCPLIEKPAHGQK